MYKSKLNLKDIKLLEILDINSRSSLKDISKKLNITKQACGKKIIQLKKNNIFKFNPVINYFNLGYNNLHMYFKLKNINSPEYDSIINNLEKDERITWIIRFFGDYDLGISIFFKTHLELKKILGGIYKLLGNYIIKEKKHWILKQFIQSFNITDTFKKNITVIENPGLNPDISSNELEIIKLLKQNCKMSFLELSKILDKKPVTVKKYLSSLEKKEIIPNYKILIDYNKIGFIWSLCYFKIKVNNNISTLINILNNENRIPFISITLEDDIIIDFLSKDYSELKDYINKIKDEFPFIQEYFILNIDKLFKLKEI